jgi:WD40 repeat protein
MVLAAVHDPERVRRWSTLAVDMLRRMIPWSTRFHDGKVNSAAWSPDGKRIVTASSDGTARIWLCSIPALQQALRDATTDCLTPHERCTYLLETEPEARRAYEACERSHNRTPASATAQP